MPDWEEKTDRFERRIAEKVIKPDDEPFGETRKDKLLAAGLGAISGLAFSMAPLLVKRKPRLRDMIEDTLKGSIVGITAPTLANVILKEKRGELPSSAVDEEYAKRREMKQDVDTIVAAYPMKKESGLLTTPLRFAAGAGKNVGGALWRGALANPFSKKIGVGERIWGAAVKGGALYGGIKGVKAVRASRQRSGTNYATLLRNNILAGNIKPHQLSQADLIAVRQLGMK